MKLLRVLANLGYGSRKQVSLMFRDGRVADTHGRHLDADDEVPHECVRVDGAPLDPAVGMVLMLHKPVGITCSHKDRGRLVYSLLPQQFGLRKPALSTVGRLDRDTSGLLLLTDNGILLHRIISPRAEIAKVYDVGLAHALRGDEAELFASGTLMLESETKPLAPAWLQRVESHRARLTIREGRYHQIRRMFAAVGNHVESLHRSALGGLTLGTLASGEWRLLDDHDVALIFVTPATPEAP